MPTPLAEQTVTAYLSNEDSPDIRNPIHSTAGGSKFGFQGALVGGVTVYGWAAEMILGVLGEIWLEDGWVDIAFKRPIYPGEQIVMRLEEGGDQGHTLTISGVDDSERIIGHVGLGKAPWFPELSSPTTLTPELLPEIPIRPLTLQSAPIGQELIPVPMEMDQEAAGEYARVKQRSADERFTGASPLLHPAIVAGFETMMIYGQFQFSPGIHVSSHVQHLARPNAGDRYVAIGRWIEAFEKKGRHHGIVDGSLVRDGVEVARARQGVIFGFA